MKEQYKAIIGWIGIDSAGKTMSFQTLPEKHLYTPVYRKKKWAKAQHGAARKVIVLLEWDGLCTIAGAVIA